MILEFTHVSFQHIFCEFNEVADELSKKSIDDMDARLIYEEFRVGRVTDTCSFSIF